MNLEIALAVTVAFPSDWPLESTKTGAANPWTSRRLLQAELGAMV
jgi:hypothetical protein